MSVEMVYVGLIALVAGLFVWERIAPQTVAKIEESIIAILLATITLVAFVQVIARYGFGGGWQGALEFQRIVFAWLILFGMSYGIKVNMHLGVDAVIKLLPPKLFRLAALFGAVCVFAYAMALLSSAWLVWLGADTRGGAIDYWHRFSKLGIGLDDLRYPVWWQEFFGTQERVQRWVAYLILPVGLSLLAFRSAQAFISIFKGERQMIIASHEAEELVAENKDILKD